MSERKKILWLASWYPSRNDRFDGDFIQRHARAAAIYHDVHVIFVIDADLDHALEEEWNYATGLTEQIIYFKRTSGFLKRTRKHLVWKSLFRGAIKKYLQQEGAPHCVHVHIPWKAGLLAIWMKEKWSLPVLVTEHWGIYNREVSDHFYRRPSFVQQSIRKIFRDASFVTTVSTYLADGIEKATGRKTDMILPNVVDTSLFFNKKEKYSKFSFIHVSNMVALKNADTILEAFSELVRKEGRDIQLIMVGNRDQRFLDLADRLDILNTSVFFRGEIPYREVAEEMQKSHCLVMFSRTETFSCVTAEALCCGLPVIASAAGALPELVGNNNGLLVKPGDKAALVDAMQKMLGHYGRYDSEEISAAAASKYGYSAVAQGFDTLYKNPQLSGDAVSGAQDSTGG